MGPGETGMRRNARSRWQSELRGRTAARVLGLSLFGLAIGGCASTSPTVNAPVPTSAGLTAPTKENASRINVQLGVNYLRQGDLQLAKQKLDRALAQDPDNPEAHAAMALFDERVGKVKDADREYRRAISLSNRAPAMLNSYGAYLCSHNRADEGVRDLDEAAANPLYTTPWAAYTNAGVCLQSVHRYPEAIAHYERALQSNPGFAEAALRAADLDYSQHQYAEARLRVELYLLSYRATPELLLLGWRIATAQSDPVAQSRYASRLAAEFPNSTQAHEVALGAVGQGG